jgi:hypothetical protein
MDAGINAAKAMPIPTPLPVSWLGLASAPELPPGWAAIPQLTSLQIRNLQAQIGYDQSRWNYSLVGESNQLGQYQFTTSILESYGILSPGSNAAHGTSCVNYLHCWRPTYISGAQNVYQNYFYNITSLANFLATPVAQDHLAYQRIFDLYNQCVNVGAIQSTDAADVVAGMIYVAWTLGVGNSNSGGGAWAWRYTALGSGISSFNSGRYSVVVLSR